MPKKKQTFESALARLEEIVEDIESGRVPLADSLALYQEGVEMAKVCAEALSAAEQSVTQLQQNADGGFAQIPFAAEEE